MQKTSSALEEESLYNPILTAATSTTNAALAAALTAIGSLNMTLLLSPIDGAGALSTWVISSSQTVPRNVTLRVPRGALLSVNTGVTLTLAGPVVADDPDWYSGLGTVVFQNTPAGSEERYPLEMSGILYSGGTHSTSGTTTSPSFAASFITPDGRHAVQNATTVTYSGGDGTYWLAGHKDTTTTVSGWTRQSGTHYLFKIASSQPDNPTGALVLAKVTVAASAITACVRVASSDPSKYPLGLNVEAFGASASGSASANATAIQAALNVAAAAGLGIYVPGNYAVTQVLVATGVKSIQGPGSFIGTGVVGNAVVELSGTVVGLDYSVNINMSGGARRGIFGVAHSGTFHDFQITDFTDVNGHGGIFLEPDSAYCTISNVFVSMVFPPLLPNHTSTGMFLRSDVTDNFGTYFSSGTGASEDPTNPVHHITITGCIVLGGSHGIFCEGIRYCTIVGNTVMRSWHRAVALEPSCKHNTITGNTLFDFYSSAVLLGYGAQYNVVAGNVCSSTVTNGQAAINMFLGPVGNTITGNTIKIGGSAAFFGVYCSIGAAGNVISDNNISGHLRAGVALESDWQQTGSLPATAYYSLVPQGTPVSVGGTGTAWAFAVCSDNVVQGNVIGECTGATAAGIYVAALGTTFGITRTIVRNNHVSGNTHDHQWYVFEEDPAAPVTDIYLLDNSWRHGFYGMGTRDQAHYGAIKGNYALDHTVIYGFSDGDTTPSVVVGNDFVTQNTGSTTITMFDGTILSQREITVRLDVNTGMTHNNAKIRLVGSSIAPGGVDSNFFIHFRNVAGVWFEMWRRN